jgi:hypothetical protein
MVLLEGCAILCPWKRQAEIPVVQRFYFILLFSFLCPCEKGLFAPLVHSIT